MTHRPKIPVYKKVLDDMRSQIVDGEYKVGDLLPSENDLAKTYDTTRATVRHALSELLHLGYINRIQGKGSIVIERKKGLGILSVKGVTAGVGKKNLKTVIMEKPREMDWPDPFYYDLTKQEKMAGCIFFSRLRFVNDVPVIYEETHIVNHSLPGFTKRKLQNKSLFQTLRDHYKIEVIGGEQRIWAIAATKHLSELLKIRAGSPVTRLERKLKTNTEDICIYSSVYCNTQDFFLQDYF